MCEWLNEGIKSQGLGPLPCKQGHLSCNSRTHVQCVRRGTFVDTEIDQPSLT